MRGHAMIQGHGLSARATAVCGDPIHAVNPGRSGHIFSNILFCSSGSGSRWLYRWIIRSARLRWDRSIAAYSLARNLLSPVDTEVRFRDTTFSPSVHNRYGKLTYQECALAVTAWIPAILKKPFIFPCDRLEFFSKPLREPTADRRACRKEPVGGDVPVSRLRRGGGIDGLCRRSRGVAQAHGQ